MTKETRQAEVLEVRDATETSSPAADIRIVTYDTVDTYRTTFAPNSFARAISEGSIPSVFSHDPSRPIGVVSNLRNSATSLEGTLEFLDFGSCPDAKMVHEAMRKGAIRGVSFGFERLADEDDPNTRGVTRITDINVFEASPVLRNSIPGSRVLAVRSDETISRKAVQALFIKLTTGEIDLTDALVALKSGTIGEEPPAEVDEVEPLPEVEPDPDELEILDHLASLERGVKTKPYGNVKYADEKNGKYPVDTKAHAKAALAYISMPKNAAMYPMNGVQLSAVKAKIVAACKKFGIQVGE